MALGEGGLKMGVRVYGVFGEIVFLNEMWFEDFEGVVVLFLLTIL